MTISDMHILFRAVGQQMGLQRVRAILPETIDVYLNDAINEKVRSLVMGNTAMQFPDKITIQHNPVSPVNALRTLYKTVSIPTFNNGTSAWTDDHYEMLLDIVQDLSGIVLFDPGDVMLYTSFATINQASNKKAKCRIIEHDELYNVIHDFCNSPSEDYPIVSITCDRNKSVNVAKVYDGTENNNYHPMDYLEINYIKNPVIVNHYAGTDSDLPDYLHTEIVEIAVQKYFKSVGSTTQPVK